MANRAPRMIPCERSLCPPVLIAAAVLAIAGCASRTSLRGKDVGEHSSDSPVEVELPARMCGHYFLARASINDRGPYWLLIDTGASHTYITPRVARETSVTHEIKQFRVGEFSRTNIPARVRNLSNIEEAVGLPVHGIVAHHVFRDVLLTYDYPNGRLTVSTARLRESDPGVCRTLGHIRPAIRATTTNGARFSVVVDTGAAHGISVNQIDKLQLESTPRPTGARLGIKGYALVRSARLSGNLRVGPVTLVRPIVDVETSQSGNLLGQEVLRHFTVRFDQRRNLAQFLPVENCTVEMKSCYGIGAATALYAQKEGRVVLKVFENSGAKQAGLKRGDRIIAINGVPQVHDGCRIDEKIQPDGGALNLRVIRGDSEVALRVPVELLIE